MVFFELIYVLNVLENGHLATTTGYLFAGWRLVLWVTQKSLWYPAGAKHRSTFKLLATDIRAHRFRLKICFGSKRNGFRSHFSVSNENEDERRTRRFHLKLFSVLSETVFAQTFPFRTKTKNERRTLNTSTSLLPVVREY
jgi:hypothetical protein